MTLQLSTTQFKSTVARSVQIQDKRGKTPAICKQCIFRRYKQELKKQNCAISHYYQISKVKQLIRLKFGKRN